MSRIFDHKKQYACTEVFRMEDIQSLIEELENIDDEEINNRRLPYHARRRFNGVEIKDVIKRLQEFLDNMIEQERRKQ